MKAIVYHNYGSADVLQYEETEKPIPKDNAVLMKVRAASVNPLDWGLMKGGGRIVTGLRRPKFTRLGVDRGWVSRACAAAILPDKEETESGASRSQLSLFDDVSCSALS